MKLSQIEPVVVQKNVSIELTPAEAKLVMDWMFAGVTSAKSSLSDRHTDRETLSAQLYLALSDLGYGK